MSFIETYLNNYRLDEIPDSVKDKMDQLQSEMSSNAKIEDFDECLKQFGPQLADLSTRLSQKVHNLKVSSLKESIDLFRFVKSTAFEVYQVVQGLENCAIPEDLSEVEAEKARVEFGANLTYFIWLSVDPLKNRFNGLPFKKTLEKWVVKWLARMSIQFTMDFMEKYGVIKSMSIETSYLKVL